MELTEEQKRRAANRDGEDKCPECGGWFEGVGQHWSISDCSPELSEREKDICVGLLMGDGCIHQDGLDVTMTNKKFLRWLSEEFGAMATNVREKKTQNPWSVKDQYRVRIRTCDFTRGLRDWYSSGEKVFPDDINLTPTVLKFWYISDGHLHKEQTYLSIACQNEIENAEKLLRMIEDAGLPEPNVVEAGAIEWSSCNINAVLDYMGDPVPGFEYKWTDD